MEDDKKIKLFLSSPGDVEEERKKVHEVAAQLNRMLGDRLKISIEVIDWKTHVAPDMGRPQEIINRQTGDYDIFVGIMWKRFGKPTGKAGSGTEEEFRIAYDKWEKDKRPRILFYFSTMPYFTEDLEEIKQWGKVIEFKKEFDQKGLICKYQSTEEFADLLREHLNKVIYEWFPAKGEKSKLRADFTKYFTYLKSETMYMDIRGLVTGEGKAHQFRIDELYIPLKTASGAGLPSEKKGKRGEQNYPEEMGPREVQLQEVLMQPRLIIRGDPGTGKTTFLRLISFALCKEGLGEEPSPGIPKIPWSEHLPVPILIKIGRLIEHIKEWKKRDPHQTPTSEASPEWIFHFLDKQSKEFNWKVLSDDFRLELEEGRCVILLDGLDETPDQATREKISSLASNMINAYPTKCRVVLTSRPAALIGLAKPLGFAMVDIAPLDESTMETFLTKWCGALYSEAPGKSCEHKKELSFALQARPEIRRMARTPVMLTALAVVHWNEHRLPEQRADLYESIITWLFRSRAQRSGRLTIDMCRRLLQKLALAMFTHKEGRQRQVTFHWAAEILAGEFVSQGENTSIDKSTMKLGEFFLRDEVVDSGIIVERGHRLEFWHLSFQEYLAAFEVAGLLDTEQAELLFKNDRIYSSEWRELVLLLGGVLYKQGIEKVNHLINEIIVRGPQEGNNQTLPELAKEVGLLGGIVHDLVPFKFKPANETYPEIVQSVMGIFDKENYRNIPVQVRIEAADTLGQVGDPRLEDNPMVSIAGGRFWMGAQKRDTKERNYDPEADESDWNEAPVHQVELSSFQISKYPVTVGQYQKFIEDGGYEDERYWRAGGFGELNELKNWDDQKQFPSRPVVKVSWYEAAAYASWAGGRLPTEAEWERTARGPQQEYRKYPWGNEEPIGETANFDESKIGHLTPVGIFPDDCSPEGVVDMAGNVWEWCNDWFNNDYYRMCAEKGIVNNPEGPETGDSRVIRGGSFYDDRYDLRCANRDRVEPRLRIILIGFRVVRAI